MGSNHSYIFESKGCHPHVHFQGRSVTAVLRDVFLIGVDANILFLMRKNRLKNFCLIFDWESFKPLERQTQIFRTAFSKKKN